MKVYIVMHVVPYEWEMPDTVYINEEDAKKHVEAYNKIHNMRDEYEEYIVRLLKDNFDKLEDYSL